MRSKIAFQADASRNAFVFPHTIETRFEASRLTPSFTIVEFFEGVRAFLLAGRFSSAPVTVPIVARVTIAQIGRYTTTFGRSSTIVSVPIVATMTRTQFKRSIVTSGVEDAKFLTNASVVVGSNKAFFACASSLALFRGAIGCRIGTSRFAAGAFLVDLITHASVLFR